MTLLQSAGLLLFLGIFLFSVLIVFVDKLPVRSRGLRPYKKKNHHTKIKHEGDVKT